jgi:hypothetical protein
LQERPGSIPRLNPPAQSPGSIPRLNPSSALIKGVGCGVRVEDIEEPTLLEIRYLDKLIDELAKGRAIEKILRQ